MSEKPKFDVVIALGKSWQNVKPEEKSAELSTESKLTTLAAGRMYETKLASHIIFSSGRTTQLDIYEAVEMKKHLEISRYTVLPQYVTEETNSWSTHTNALESHKLVQELGFTHPALLTTYPHTIRAQIIFNNNGFSLKNDDVYSSYWVLKNDFRYTIDEYKKTFKYYKEFLKEMLCLAITTTIDPKGEFLSRIAARTRHRT